MKMKKLVGFHQLAEPTKTLFVNTWVKYQRWFFVVAFGVVVVGCASDRSSIKVKGTTKMTVAVVDLDMPGTEKGDKLHAGWRNGLIPEVETYMAETGKFSVINRERLETILKEQALSLSGLIEVKDYGQVGKIAKVEGLIIILVVRTGDQARVTLQLINTETAQLMASGSAVGGWDNWIEGAVREASRKLAEAIVP